MLKLRINLQINLPDQTGIISKKKNKQVNEVAMEKTFFDLRLQMGPWLKSHFKVILIYLISTSNSMVSSAVNDKFDEW